MLSLIFIAFYIEVYGGFLLLILDKENFFRGKKIQDKLKVSVTPLLQDWTCSAVRNALAYLFMGLHMKYWNKLRAAATFLCLLQHKLCSSDSISVIAELFTCSRTNVTFLQ
jgi:hypothetical protein